MFKKRESSSKGWVFSLIVFGLLTSFFLGSQDRGMSSSNFIYTTSSEASSSRNFAQLSSADKRDLRSVITRNGHPCARITFAKGPVGGSRFHVSCDNNGSGAVYVVEYLGNHYWNVKRKY